MTMEGKNLSVSVKSQLEKLIDMSLKMIIPCDTEVLPMVAPCSQKFGDYQCNNAMSLFLKIKGKSTFQNPRSVAEAIVGNVPSSEIIESLSVAGPGFVNIAVSDHWIAKRIKHMLVEGIRTWAPKLPLKRAVVDFSSPNIAKELHVGHLRSTIIGDSLARMLEFSSVEVLRRNHVGDWGTQFGKLLAYLFEKFPDWEDEAEVPIRDLQKFYKEAQKKYEDDPIFEKEARMAVVKLQSGETRYRKAWEGICNISRLEYEKIYQCLGISLVEKGESFYHPYIPGVLQILREKDLVAEKDGALMVTVEGMSAVVTKSDGGYNYASTDLSALWYRVNEEKADWIIYVTDYTQEDHFRVILLVAKQAGWLAPADDSYPKATHVSFGLVFGPDGKRFRTRSTEVFKLIDLLDEAKSRSKSVLIERAKMKGRVWTDEELEQIAKAVGYGAVKYADLKNNRRTNYSFNLDQMLDAKGNTAVYLLYTHARICSIIKKSGVCMEDLVRMGEISLDHADERALALHLVQFAEMIETALENLLPSIVCEYVYNLAESFAKFYTNCQVVGSGHEASRLLLCEATAVVMRNCFHLLGIEVVDKL